MKKRYLNTLLIGSGLAGLNFASVYGKKKKLEIISPNFSKFNTNKEDEETRFLPPQMEGKLDFVNNYKVFNNLKINKNCTILGSLNYGGLSDFWGLQIDNYISKDLNVSNLTYKKIEKHFLSLLKEHSLIGEFKVLKKIYYENKYKIPISFNNLINSANYKKKIECRLPILAYQKKKTKKLVDFNNLNEKKDKFIPSNLRKCKSIKKIIHHNLAVNKIEKIKNIYKIKCYNQNFEEKIFFCKKLILGCGTIATTKLVMDFLNIRNEVKIKHHLRLFAFFLSRNPIIYKINFLPSILQILIKGKNFFSADLRVGNKFITNSIIELYKFLSPFKFFINLFNKYFLFSNILMGSSGSNLFIKKDKNNFYKIYSKDKNHNEKKLKLIAKKVYNFLYKKKIIFPFFKTYFPSIGSDFHYFGTIPIQKKGRLVVNEKCQLKGHRNIYIIDGSVFNFKSNTYPLGIITANARRIGESLIK